MTDEALDRDLAAAFSVDHSPEFVARVRMHVEAMPMRSPWARFWPALATVVAVPIVALIVLLLERPRPVDVPHRTPTTARVTPASRPSAITARTTPTIASPAPVVAARTRRAPAPSEPIVEVERRADVLIPREERDAFLMLVRGISSEPIPSDIKVVEPDLQAPPSAIADIVIQPIVIAPLQDGSQLQGASE